MEENKGNQKIIKRIIIWVLIFIIYAIIFNVVIDYVTQYGSSNQKGAVQKEKNVEKLTLTSSRISDIEDEISRYEDYWYRFIFERVFTEYTFSSFDIQSQRKTGDKTYTVYGFLYMTDDYKNHMQKVRIDYFCVKDPSKSEGYKIEREYHFDDK